LLVLDVTVLRCEHNLKEMNLVFIGNKYNMYIWIRFSFTLCPLPNRDLKEKKKNLQKKNLNKPALRTFYLLRQKLQNFPVWSQQSLCLKSCGQKETLIESKHPWQPSPTGYGSTSRLQETHS